MELVLTDNVEPFLCLNMIVKNESHIIKNTLTKLLKKVKFDYWVISDTGSTDNTKEFITEFFKETGVPGELFEDEWKDFGYNRTKALEHAFGKSKFLLVFDADDEICGNFVLPELTKDSYHLQFGDSNGISYTRTQIINNKKKWKYVGVLHEIITAVENTNGMEIITGDYFTVSGKTGDRSRDRNKYLNDALILEKAYEEAIQNNDEIYNRYGFYCANSYYDCGKHEDAIKWYKKTLENHNWSQEKYVSCLRMYNCYNALNQKENGFFYLVKSTEYDKERTECLYELISYYCCNGLYEVAYGYYTIIKDFYDEQFLTVGLNNKLFLDCSKSNLYLPYYMILVADKKHDYDTVIQMFRIIFTKKHKEHNKFFIGNMLYNLQFFIERVKEIDIDNFKELFKGYVDFLISINYPVYDHEFMSKYEKYGIILPKFSKPIFSLEECSKSKKILIYAGYAPCKWNYTFSINNALGGSETAISCLSKFLPKEYEIYIAGEVDEEKFDNITYINSHNLHNLIKTTAFHTIIVSRYLHFYELYKNFSSYQTFIWGHDIALYQYGTDVSVENILTKWSAKITGCVCQTEWHKNHFLSLYPQLKDKINVINNGINTELFTFKNKKVSNRFIYTSCSERGLNKLTELWPSILENLPDAELIISSYNNFPKSEEDNKIFEYIQKTPSITHVGKLNRTELYNSMSTAEYWLYPSYFQETSCITSLELLASEVICLYYPVAGLVNTIGDYGIPVSEGNEIDKLLNLSIKQKSELKKKGKEYAFNCSWKNRADEWCNMIFSSETNELTKFKNEPIIEKNNIKVINLKKREDRKKSMTSQFERENITNYEFIEAVDGSELKESEELRLLFTRNNFTYRKGVIGCALSHLNIYNSLIHDNNNDYYVVLEDDLELSNDFKEKLKIHCKLFEEQKLEHLSLGVYECNYSDQEKIKTNEVTVFQKDIYKFWNITFAYIISKEAARKMVSYINSCSIKCAIDNPLSHGEVIKYYHTTHCIAKQKNIGELGSDVQNNCNLQFTNHTQNNKDFRLSYCDWWYNEYCGGNFDYNNNFIIDILRKYGNIGEIILVEPYQNPDVLFYSIFGNEHSKFPNVRRVFFSGEPFGIRAEADFNFTFDRNSDKNIRFPLWLGYLNDYLLEECQRRKNGIINVPKRENFCSFIANGEVKTTHRRTIVEKLSKYKKVHCGGNYLNNIGFNVPRGVNCSGKIEHNNKYKFAIAFENEDYPGYVTEKICDIFKSNCVPIYWGTKEVVNDFNPSTFINARDFANFDELVEYIIKVDNDDELYASFFKEPMFSNKWLDVFNDPNKTFYKNLADCIIGKNKKLYDNYLTNLTNLTNINNHDYLDLWKHNNIDNIYNFPVSKRWFCTSELKNYILQNFKLNDTYNILEIGSFEGCSSCFLSDILLNNKNSKLICVDPFISDGTIFVNSNNLKNTFYSNIKKSKNYTKITIEEKYSNDFYESYKGNKFNFIYIDGEHSDTQIKTDLVECFKLLEVNGIMWCDDYNNNWKKTFVNWIEKNNKYIKIIHDSYQLGIVKISEEKVDDNIIETCDSLKKNTAYICGCVKNCEQYLSKVFDNIKNITTLFDSYKIVIAYDSSNDNTYNYLIEMKKIFNIEIINCNNNFNTRVENICNARNAILQYIRSNKDELYEYLIMMDLDNVSCEKMNTNIIKYYLNRNDWDSLSFNSSDYYDIFALSIEPYIHSCWHWKNDEDIQVTEVVTIMRNYVKEKLSVIEKTGLVECLSAFNGLSLYRIEKFKNCEYSCDHAYNIDFLNKNIGDNWLEKNIIALDNKYRLRFDEKQDCEHRMFHLEAIYKNNAKIGISPLSIFDFSNETNDLIKNNTYNTALIIEPRDDDDVIDVIFDFNNKLNKDSHNWQIVFYCGKNLKTKWMSVFKDINIEIRELDTNNLTQNEYSDFCKNKELWESLYGEFVLVFQLDTIIRNEEPYTIDYFTKLNKSFIGGNMYYNWHELTRENIHINIKNLNGGLSLRKRLDMIKIIETFNPENTIRPSYKIQTDAEDVYFTIGCYKLNLEIGDDEASSFFAVHTIIKEQFFGCHNPCIEIKQKLLDIYPDAIKNRHIFKPNTFNISNNYKIEYGIDTKKIDITDIVKKNKKFGFSYIPSNDEVRASLFGDPLYGSVKKIFFTNEKIKYVIEPNDFAYLDITSSKLYINQHMPIKKDNLSIMAIFKNETMNLRVWIEHYLWQGVEHFYLIDNDSTDNPLDILQEYIDKGIITYYFKPEKHQQSQHYRCVFDSENIKEKTNWLCICDLDEFFFGTEKKLIDTLIDFNNYDVIYTNSFFYGSDNLIDHPTDIRTAIVHRQEDMKNGIKYIFKTSCINDSSEIWIHWLVHPGSLQKKILTTETTDNKKIRLNHYHIQSFEYFKNIKMTRGDADIQQHENSRNLEYFEHYRKISTIKDDTLKLIIENNY
jgi:GR25 family glycosyltransferase involved in LPS biosynthesis/predicted O-methyltransferase YrrM